MFSEYASRFLAQSQSRLTNIVQPENVAGDGNRRPGDRYRRANHSLRNPSDRYPQSQSNPYQLSHLSRLNFTSRYAPAPDAPLFHSALDDFREEDDAEERERETADFFALQRSRRVFASSKVEESSETDHEGSNLSLEGSEAVDERDIDGRGRARGIKSSWNGSGRRSIAGKNIRIPETEPEEPMLPGDHLEGSSAASGKTQDKMVDVGLGSAMEDGVPPDDLAIGTSPDDSPPAFQRFRSGPANCSPAEMKHNRQDADLESGLEAGESGSQPPPSVADTTPLMTTLAGEVPRHDAFWSSLFLICFGALFATFFLVYIHTSTSGTNLGDTIYTTLRASLHLFAVDTVVSIVVSLVWLALLRSFVKPLVHLILFAVPTILFSFSLYSLVASYRGPAGGTALQDKAMRWLSSIPGVFALVWLYTMYQGRHSLTKATAILEFASRILTANPALITLGFGTLAAVIAWTWMWLGMFTRVFLGGEMSRSMARFVIDATSWWLGVYFVIIYIWTLSVIGGLQRSTTAATISQWYFHRNIVSAPSSREIVTAALAHAMTTLFGTICFSTFLTLLVRLPLLLLPRRLVGVATVFFHSLVPTTITSLTNPLTLTYAAIHSQPLHMSAQGLSQITFLVPQTALNTGRRTIISHPPRSTPLLPYRLAKLILHATRFIMAMALGFGGWVATARQLSITMPEGAGIRGSAYAYVVGLVAGFIGWGVLGAMEGVLSGIVDAAVICWGSEKNMTGGGAYCLEAESLFGEGRNGA